MFTDIVGYTSMMGEDEQKAINLLDKFLAVQKPLIAHHGGRIHNEIGDGILSAFDSAIDAVGCAIEIRQKLKDDPSLKIRIGIHVGDVLFRGGDVFGDGVNIASRIESLAQPGEILISSPVFDSVKNQEGIKAEFVDVANLKNVEKPTEIYRVKNLKLDKGFSSGISHRTKIWKSNRKKIGVISIVAIILSVIAYLPYFNSKERQIVEGFDKSIAVLPIKNMSNDPDNQNFCDGVMEGILDRLEKIEGLRVVSRTSTEGYRDKAPLMSEIVEDLNVTYVIEASIFKSENKIRTTAQLINARTDEHLWSDQYDEELRDVFAVMNAISTQVANEIKVIVSPEVRRRIETTPTENQEAFEFYLQGRHFWGLEDLDMSIHYYDKAIELDPDFALAYVGVATTYNSYGWYLHLPYREVIPLAKKAALKALEIDSTLGEAYGELAFSTMLLDLDWNGAELAFKNALELSPGDARSHYLYSLFLSYTGRHEEAIEQITIAHELDPLNSEIWIELGRRYYFARRYDEAIEVYKDFFAKLPFSAIAWFGHAEYAKALSKKGMHQEAIDEYLKKDFEWTYGWNLGFIYGVAGQDDKAREILDFYLNKSKEGFTSLHSLTMIYLGLGEKEKALEWMEKSFEQLEGFRLHLKVDPMLDDLRDHPQFQIYMDKLGFPD